MLEKREFTGFMNDNQQIENFCEPGVLSLPFRAERENPVGIFSFRLGMRSVAGIRG